MNYLEIIKQKLGKYPIGAWVPYYEHNLNKEYFTQISDCGINFIPTNKCNKEELDLISSAGIKLMVNDERLTYANITQIVSVKDYLKEYKDREDVLSVFIWDEPSPTMMDLCAVLNKQVDKYAENIFGYINLHPNYSDKGLQRDGLTYGEYLQYFVDSCNPKVISYDHYPFFLNKIGHEEMFDNLNEVRKCCDNNNLEFMTFVQSAEYYNHILPSTEMLRYQVATALAYGAKGILYFTYAQVIHDANSENFGPAVLDKEGNKTHAYDAIKEINQEIQNNGMLFMDLNHKGVVFFSDKYDKFTTAKPDFEIDSNEVLVGIFELDGKNYYYLVNLDLENEKTITLTKGDKSVAVTLKAGGGELTSL